MIRILAVVNLVLLVLTIGCGFAIHFGGETFRDGIKGHLVLGVLSMVTSIVLLVLIFKQH